MAWTIEVDGAAKNFKNADFESVLKTNAPTEFSALIEYEALAYFSLIEIKNGATVEGKAFLKRKKFNGRKVEDIYILVGETRRLFCGKNIPKTSQTCMKILLDSLVGLVQLN